MGKRFRKKYKNHRFKITERRWVRIPESLLLLGKQKWREHSLYSVLRWDSREKKLGIEIFREFLLLLKIMAFFNRGKLFTHCTHCLL